jgi:hypothetical protein
LGRGLEDVVEVFTSLVEPTNKTGLEVDEMKTKSVVVSQKLYSGNEFVKTGTYNFEVVNDCTYFGTVLTNKYELRPEMEERITNANRALCTSSSTKESVTTHSRKNKSQYDSWQCMEQNLGHE